MECNRCPQEIDKVSFASAGSSAVQCLDELKASCPQIRCSNRCIDTPPSSFCLIAEVSIKDKFIIELFKFAFTAILLKQAYADRYLVR